MQQTLELFGYPTHKAVRLDILGQVYIYYVVKKKADSFLETAFSMKFQLY